MPGFRISLLSICCALVPFIGGHAIAETKLTIGQASLSASGWPVFVADDQGWFKKDGLKPETIYVGSVAAVAQQTIGGSLDIGYTNFEEAIQAIQAGAPIALIGSTLIKYPYSMMSTKTVTTAADLKGKKVILPIPHADVANFFDMWLNENHVPLSSVDRVYDGSSTNRYASLVAGAVSAAAIISPLDFTAARSGFFKLVDFGKYVKHYGFVGIVARKDWLALHGKLVTAYLADVARGVAWLYDPKNEERAIDILMRATKQSRPVAQETYDSYFKSIQPFSRGLKISDADLMNVADAMAKAGRIKATSDMKVSKFVDLSYLPDHGK